MIHMSAYVVASMWVAESTHEHHPCMCQSNKNTHLSLILILSLNHEPHACLNCAYYEPDHEPTQMQSRNMVAKMQYAAAFQIGQARRSTGVG